MIKETGQAIDTILKTLTGPGQPISEVFDYYTLNAKGYPYLCFELEKVDGKVASSCDNERKIFWDIYLIQEINHLKRQQALPIMYDALEATLNALDTISIPGAHTIEATSSTFGQFQSDKGNILMAPISLSITYYQGV